MHQGNRSEASEPTWLQKKKVLWRARWMAIKYIFAEKSYVCRVRYKDNGEPAMDVIIFSCDYEDMHNAAIFMDQQFRLTKEKREIMHQFGMN